MSAGCASRTAGAAADSGVWLPSFKSFSPECGCAPGIDGAGRRRVYAGSGDVPHDHNGFGNGGVQVMKIAVMGAGAVGCYYGAMLARAGHEVTLVGRPQHVEAVNRDGLFLDSQAFRGPVPMAA